MRMRATHKHAEGVWIERVTEASVGHRLPYIPTEYLFNLSLNIVFVNIIFIYYEEMRRKAAPGLRLI